MSSSTVFATLDFWQVGLLCVKVKVWMFVSRWRICDLQDMGSTPTGALVSPHNFCEQGLHTKLLIHTGVHNLSALSLWWHLTLLLEHKPWTSGFVLIASQCQVAGFWNETSAYWSLSSTHIRLEDIQHVTCPNLMAIELKDHFVKQTVFAYRHCPLLPSRNIFFQHLANN